MSDKWSDSFLIERDPKSWTTPDGFPKHFRPQEMFVQDAANGLEVVLVDCSSRPSVADMRKAWEKRRAGRASPVLVVAGYPGTDGPQLAICGPVGDQPAVHLDLAVDRGERLADLALSERTHHAATRFLLAALPELESDLPGLRNVGLLATQELRAGVPEREDWSQACKRAASLMSSRGKDLVQGLGFGVDTLATNASMLTVGGSRRVVAVFLDEGETFDAPAQRFGTTPVSHALAVAEQQNAPWVVLTRGSEIRLYAARPDTGVGRKGRAETFVEANLALLPSDRAGYLQLLFSSEALAENGTIEEILGDSERFAAELAVRLRQRIYFDTVPTLATAIADRMTDDPTEDDLADAYERVMVILFRLLFLAYAEDKDLLPYRTNSRYADHSLSRIVQRLVEDHRAERLTFDEGASDLWEDVTQLWRAVDKGRSSWGVPAYNGGLFSDDPEVSASGASLYDLDLTDAEFGPALAAMLIDQGPEGAGPVDFRSLSVREFGTIYEGLLESQLSVAPSDLSVDKDGNYVPSKKGDTVLVEEGAVYFHNRSGERKSTGSYFTKPFAVEHLLDHALEPALADHLARLDELDAAGDEAALADAFFDFKCADIAMGSAHFLVAAVDRIERRLSDWIALHPVPTVSAELDRLRTAAYEALGDLGDGIEIESSSLLRRQVARRCIYGVDYNTVAVDLARLAVWIHTFVPGLPLSFLDHNLVCGDSLTGVGTLEEVVQLLDPDADAGANNLFRDQIEDFLSAADKSLSRLAVVAGASATEIAEARTAHLEAVRAVEPATHLFDLVTAHRANQVSTPVNLDPDSLKRQWETLDPDLIDRMSPIHFPTVFPEIFLRSRPGFDCIVGNPPWEKLLVDERQFWSLRFPGIRSLPVNKLNSEIKSLSKYRGDLANAFLEERRRVDEIRETLLRGNYRDLGRGHPDLYKAFSWRFLDLLTDGGRLGVVLPRSALSSAGSASWREAVMRDGAFEDVTLTVNRGGWVFDDAEPRYTIAFICLKKGLGDDETAACSLRGPYSSIVDYRKGLSEPSIQIAAKQVQSWTKTHAFPMIENEGMYRTFLRMRESPSLDSHPTLRFLPVQGDLNATGGKKLMNYSQQGWPVYKGASFNIWSPDTGVYYAHAQEHVVVPALFTRRLKSARRANSAFSRFPAPYLQDVETLPCVNPRIAYRRIARSTDTRTVIACLVPPHVILTDKAAYLVNQPEADGIPDCLKEAFLLGVLSSMVLDWYARRVVEVQLDFHVIESFPIPLADLQNDSLAARVAVLASSLAAVDPRFADWAANVRVSTQTMSEAGHAEMIAELDATVALLYGLDEQDLEVIYTTFHEGADYSDRLAAVIEHHRRLS